MGPYCAGPVYSTPLNKMLGSNHPLGFHSHIFFSFLKIIKKFQKVQLFLPAFQFFLIVKPNLFLFQLWRNDGKDFFSSALITCNPSLMGMYLKMKMVDFYKISGPFEIDRNLAIDQMSFFCNLIMIKFKKANFYSFPI